MDRIEAKSMAEALIAEHGLTCSFEFDRHKMRMGSCRFFDSGRLVITLSGPLVDLNSIELVRDIILHEIAHAKVGPQANHDWRWRTVAQSIGCTSTTCVDPKVVRVPGKYRAVCPGCGKVWYAYKTPKRNGNSSCGDCGHGVFNAAFALYFVPNFTLDTLYSVR